jgi:hypothetical protein
MLRGTFNGFPLALEKIIAYPFPPDECGLINTKGLVRRPDGSEVEKRLQSSESGNPKPL